jgi:internalin A
MNAFDFIFKNSGEKEFNDIIFPGSCFLLKDYSYLFTLTPKSNFWRFGIRLSEEEEINFSEVGDRHFQNYLPKYKDLHLSAGDRLDNSWVRSNFINVVQYNFSSNDHLLYRSSNYEPKSIIRLTVYHVPDKNFLYIKYENGNFIEYEMAIPIEEEYKYFKVFAWADETDFELLCNFQISILNKVESEENFNNPFKVGNVIFRLGNMLDSYAQYNSNAIMFPASSNGSTSDSVGEYANLLRIPKARIQEASSVKIYNSKLNTNLIKAGYVYSVEGHNSNIELIAKTCKQLVDAFKKLKKINNIPYTVNIPLFGSGAGGINPLVIANLYDNIFNQTGNNINFLVSILSSEVFNIVKTGMLGKYKSLPDENLQKPKEIKNLENRFNIIIDYSAFKINHNKKIISLGVNDISSEDLAFLEEFLDLESLSLLNCKIGDTSYLYKLKKLYALSIYSTSIDYSSFDKIQKLKHLEINSCKISSFNFLYKLKNLETLYLPNNKIISIDFLTDLIKLKSLDLSNNKIASILLVGRLKNLEELILSHNHISKIDSLINLNELIYLDLSHNHILDVSIILKIKSLEYLKAKSNPFLANDNLILNENDNQLNAIKSFLLRKSEETQFKIRLPAKVHLLGNHASGKSSLLNYIQNDNLSTKTQSTHIIEIEKYPVNAGSIPEALFFDFGGQDYYHGIYRVFLSSGGIYLILWDEKTNENKQRVDTNNNITQDFSLKYWLCQKKYMEDEVYYIDERDPIILIQTHSDQNKRSSFFDIENEHSFENEFYVSLSASPVLQIEKDEVNKQALKYLKSSVLELIKRKQKKTKEPSWFINFLDFILSQALNTTHIPKSIPNEILQYYNRSGNNVAIYLKEDLRQLHNQGLILYYPNDELKDYVWLNPGALAKYVHSTVLTRSIQKKYLGKVPITIFETIEPKIIELLCLQKVIFKHDFGANNQPEYIIPNFLPLVTEGDDFLLLTFDIQNPIFILKFRNFLPFGLINQIICFFGRMPDQKKFWRDRVFFSFQNKARILIHLDFEHLEIKVFGSFIKGVSEENKRDIKTYLFYSIMSLYWDSHKPLPYESFNPFYKNGFILNGIVLQHQEEELNRCKDIFEKLECKPSDLYISLDDTNYVSYRDLCSDESNVMINAKVITPTRDLAETPKVISLYQFQFLVKRTLKKQLKVVISYSKKDLRLVDTFKNYLAPLTQFNLIDEPWYCTELIAGREWNKEIENRFSEADIIFFMISDNLMSTKYVLEYEIKNAIDRWDKDKSVKIIPILLVPYNFEGKDPYNLTRFTGLPYLLRPVTQFKDQKLAWYTISETIKAMIEKNLYPSKENEPFNNEIKTIFETIVKEKWD